MSKEIKDDVIRVTLPLTDYLEDLLGSLTEGLERKSVKYETGIILDKLVQRQKPQFCHVQLTTFEGEKLSRPLVWRIKERREYNLRSENSVRIQKKLRESMEKLGVDTTDETVKQALLTMANKIAIRKNKKAADNIGAHMEL